MANLQNRRRFLKTTAAVGAGYWVAGSARRGRSQEASRSLNEKIQFACIGVGGKGTSDSADAGREGEVVAICDVDDRTLNKAAARFANAKKYFDFRDMLAEMGDQIDAVTVSTPDHNHAVAAVMAMRMGKHCFCQKPLTHSLHEARVMRDVARETGVVTQMGNQGTSLDGTRKGAAIIQAGALGKVKEVHVWTNRPIWPQGIERPQETPPVPAYLHWDQWIGPAPYRPYHEAYHPFKWRGFWDFGTGALGDMGCHTANLPFMALDLRDPVAVGAETSGHNRETYPGWSVVKYEFPARSNRGPVTMYWYDGGKLPEASLVGGVELSASGSLVVGEAGKLLSNNDYGEQWELQGVEEPEVEFERSPGHFAEWAEGIRGNGKPMSNFPDYACALTETILLGNLAVWSGKRVEWDAKNLKPTNAPELESMVRPEYRDGYSLEATTVGAAT